MTGYPRVHDVASLADAIKDARAEGSASVTVPLFSGNTHPFDELLRTGEARTYCLWVEVSLASKGGAA